MVTGCWGPYFHSFHVLNPRKGAAHTTMPANMKENETMDPSYSFRMSKARLLSEAEPCAPGPWSHPQWGPELETTPGAEPHPALSTLPSHQMPGSVKMVGCGLGIVRTFLFRGDQAPGESFIEKICIFFEARQSAEVLLRVFY